MPRSYPIKPGHYCLQAPDGRFATMTGSTPHLTDVEALRYSWSDADDKSTGTTAEPRRAAWSARLGVQLSVVRAAQPIRITRRFSECEHHGDLSAYEHDIITSGGRIVESRLADDTDDSGIEEGIITFEVDDREDFMRRFQKTDAFHFC